MPDTENWIRLARLESPRKVIALVDYFGGPEEVLRAGARDLASVEGVSTRTAERLRSLAAESVEKQVEALEKIGARVITYRDSTYPANLRQISDPPAVLFVRGEIREEDRFAVGVIGTRKPSEYGRAMAMKISRELAKRGLTVVSGGAVGIDTAAHEGALQGNGRTIVVLGTAIDQVYPYGNKALFQRVAESGAVISEFPPGTPGEAWRFPVRNRLISGLSLGVLVVESRVTGGAMITATLAGEQGRDVWALPGSTDSTNSGGPHLLIKEGAKLVEKAEDILADLGIEVEETRKERPAVPDNLTSEQKAVLGVLNLHPKHMDDIISECRLTPAIASSTLTLLEMLGLVRRVPGNCHVRAV